MRRYINLFFIFCSGYIYAEHSHSSQKRFSGLYTGPYFDPNASSNITTQLGTHAYLPCRIKQVGNRSVSWVRKRDSHILTVDRYTFVGDDRYQAFQADGTDAWTLQIKFVQPRDAGQYECQVSTEPKLSHMVTLNVVVPRIEILGDQDIHVKLGSQVELKCVITQSIEETGFIFWYHNNRRILDSKLIKIERTGSDTTVGTLVILSAKQTDAGNYTCAPTNLQSVSAYLHVLMDEHPAAMQRGKNSASLPCIWWVPFSVALGMDTCLSRHLTLMALLSFYLISSLVLFFIPES
nr:PREDICTED: hemicentin-2-like [Bemisia tabaci]